MRCHIFDGMLMVLVVLVVLHGWLTDVLQEFAAAMCAQSNAQFFDCHGLVMYPSIPAARQRRHHRWYHWPSKQRWEYGFSSIALAQKRHCGCTDAIFARHLHIHQDNVIGTVVGTVIGTVAQAKGVADRDTLSIANACSPSSASAT